MVRSRPSLNETCGSHPSSRLPRVLSQTRLYGPVGFVGSAQSKDELIARPRGMSYLVVTGRRGGSAMAAAAVNAIASERE